MNIDVEFWLEPRCAKSVLAAMVRPLCKHSMERDDFALLKTGRVLRMKAPGVNGLYRIGEIEMPLEIVGVEGSKARISRARVVLGPA